MVVAVRGCEDIWKRTDTGDKTLRMAEATGGGNGGKWWWWWWGSIIDSRHSIMHWWLHAHNMSNWWIDSTASNKITTICWLCHHWHLLMLQLTTPTVVPSCHASVMLHAFCCHCHGPFLQVPSQLFCCHDAVYLMMLPLPTANANIVIITIIWHQSHYLLPLPLKMPFSDPSLM